MSIGHGAQPYMLDFARLRRDCEHLFARLDVLRGPGTYAVRSLARQLAVALELREQEQRRLGVERFRWENAP